MDELRKAVLEAGGFAKVAEDTGVAPSHLYNVCNGNKPLTAATMRKLRPRIDLAGDTWLKLLGSTTDAA